MKKGLVLGLVLVLVLVAAGATVWFVTSDSTGARPPRTVLGKFASAEDLVKAFKNGLVADRGVMEDGLQFKSMTSVAPQTATASGAAESPEHSSTNVQVAGVDEADIVKNDGDYIYAIGGGALFIVAAYPPQQTRIVSRIDFGEGAQPAEMFIHGDTLAVIGTSGSEPVPMTEPMPGKGVNPAPRGNTTFIKVYDISDREKPALERSVRYEGSYETSRMLGQNVHVVLTTQPYYAFDGDKDIKPGDIIPLVSDTHGLTEPAGFTPAVGYRDIDVVDPEAFTSFLSVVSLSLADGSRSLNKRVIAGYSNNVYASRDNLYVAGTEYRYLGRAPWPAAQQDERTTVYKLKFNGAGTRYVASGVVPGTILNQFSMDESKGWFRIATTRGEVSREDSSSTNNVYVLDPEMKIAGRLEGLAPGERIYSVRFMGDRAYLVTFKKVDPLFVLDLADPITPRVLGALKIPGYSDYLHPYDETHIIGVGKNTVEASPQEGGNFAWYQGLKLAIFDVSDVANPREMHKVEIGDRGTDSYALNDHKAFMFEREKNLLVLPVQLAELTPEQKASPGHQANEYGSFAFDGAYVFDVTLAGGFALKGRVTHMDSTPEPGNEYGYGYYGSSDSVRRSLWIGDSLYTVSEGKIKVNRLADLGELATVRLQ